MSINIPGYSPFGVDGPGEPIRQRPFNAIRGELEDVLLDISDKYNLPIKKTLQEIITEFCRLTNRDFHSAIPHQHASPRSAVSDFFDWFTAGRTHLFPHLYRAMENIGIVPKEVNPNIQWDFTQLSDYNLDLRPGTKFSPPAPGSFSFARLQRPQAANVAQAPARGKTVNLENRVRDLSNEVLQLKKENDAMQGSQRLLKDQNQFFQLENSRLENSQRMLLEQNQALQLEITILKNAQVQAPSGLLPQAKLPPVSKPQAVAKPAPAGTTPFSQVRGAFQEGMANDYPRIVRELCYGWNALKFQPEPPFACANYPSPDDGVNAFLNHFDGPTATHSLRKLLEVIKSKDYRFGGYAVNEISEWHTQS